MHLVTFAVYLILLTILIEAGLPGLDEKLHHYEYVHSSHIEVHTHKRRSTGAHPSKELRLAAFGQNFTLELKPSTDLFTKSFGIAVIHGDGSRDTVTDFNTNDFLTGHVIGDPSSRATLHLDADNVITGVFTSAGEEYAIEPISNHVDPDHALRHTSDMIAYRRSDIKEDGKSGLCGSLHPKDSPGFDEIAFQTFDPDNQHERRRRRRQAEEGVKKTCTLIAVADYRFFAHMGQSNTFSTAQYIANIINRVNSIYTSTEFWGGYGYGFELHWMIVHDGPTTVSNMYHYNVEKSWGTAELLEAFGLSTSNSKYCLAHLFTSIVMPDSILGLAYIASSSLGSLGGMCSPMGRVNGVQSALNTGWSSSLNGAGSTVLFSHASLVTAHEFGHNMGSEHDPSSCVPFSYVGDGKYLMYAYSVTGEEPNNDQFSSCSKNAINGVLANKASGCLQVAATESRCGNGRLDDGEECDNGFFGRIGISNPCCTSACTLNLGAVCSPANKACCVNCQVASPGIQCAADIEGLCKEASTCDGLSLDCPEAPNKPEDTACLDGGSCVNGVCKNFCEYRGFNACLCNDVETSCLKCCYSSASNTSCIVNVPISVVADGRSCVQGYCQSGVCVKVATRLVERFWALIDRVDFDFVLEAFKTNMISFITAISLIIYIPICIAIWFYDNSRKKAWEKERGFEVRQDRGLDHDADRRKVIGKKPASDNMETLSARRLMGSRNQIQPMDVDARSSLA